MAHRKYSVVCGTCLWNAAWDRRFYKSPLPCVWGAHVYRMQPGMEVCTKMFFGSVSLKALGLGVYQFKYLWKSWNLQLEARAPSVSTALADQSSTGNRPDVPINCSEEPLNDPCNT